MHILPIRNLNSRKFYNSEQNLKKSPVALQSQSLNSDIAFGLAQLSDIKKAEIKKKASDKALNYAINEITYEYPTQYKTGYDYSAIDTIYNLPEEKQSELFMTNKFGVNKNQNILAVAKQGAVEELICIMNEKCKMNALKNFSKIPLSKEQLNAFYILLNSLGSEKVYEYFSSSDEEALENGALNIQALAKTSPEAVKDVLRLMNPEKHSNLVSLAVDEIGQNCSAEDISFIIATSENEELKYKLLEKSNFAQYFSSKPDETICIINYTDNDTLDKYLRSLDDSEQIFNIFEDKDIFPILVSKLSPEEYPDVYSSIKKNNLGWCVKNMTLLSASKSPAKMELPDELIVNLLKADECFYEYSSLDEKVTLVKRLGIEQFDKIFGKGKSDNVLSFAFALNILDNVRDRINHPDDYYDLEGEIDKIYSEAFEGEYKSYNSELKAKCLIACANTLSNGAISQSALIDEVQKLASQDPSLNIENSILLLDTYSKKLNGNSSTNNAFQIKSIEFSEISEYLKGILEQSES